MLISELLNGTALGLVWEEPGEGGSGGGEDTASAGGGEDTLEGGGGEDTLEGAGGDDTAEGAGGDEYTPFTVADLTIPDGLDAENEHFTTFLDTMNNQELSGTERAQAILDLQQQAFAEAGEAARTADQQTWDTLQEEWVGQLRADPDIGGDNLDANLGAIKEALTQVGATDATFEALDLTGAGNHPEIVKLFHNLTKHMREQSPVSGQPPAGAKRSAADRMFGGQKEE